MCVWEYVRERERESVCVWERVRVRVSENHADKSSVR